METLAFDEMGFGTAAKRVSWSEVCSIGIRTSDEGPFAEDVFWMFWCKCGLIELPGSAIGSAQVETMQARLPGFDNERLVRAMGSTQHRVFCLWQADAPKLVWAEDARRASFEALVRRLEGNVVGAAETFAKLSRAWNEPHRRYHDRRHLAECLLLLEALRAEAVDADVVELALWFHDAVYAPRAKDNETRSAQFLRQEAARLAIQAPRAEAAASLVEWTAHHAGKTPVPRGDAALLLDIDLSILGSDPVRFLDYEHAVEEEHPHVSSLVFRVKRGRFLAMMLSRARLFHTEVVSARLEGQARAQLKGLLASPRYRAYRFAKRCLRW